VSPRKKGLAPGRQLIQGEGMIRLKSLELSGAMRGNGEIVLVLAADQEALEDVSDACQAIKGRERLHFILQMLRAHAKEPMVHDCAGYRLDVTG
jgi:hypothetical protein